MRPYLCSLTPNSNQARRAPGIWRRKAGRYGRKPGSQQEVSVNEWVLLHPGEGHITHLPPKSDLQQFAHNPRTSTGNAGFQRLIIPGERGRKLVRFPTRFSGNSGSHRWRPCLADGSPTGAKAPGKTSSDLEPPKTGEETHASTVGDKADRLCVRAESPGRDR